MGVRSEQEKKKIKIQNGFFEPKNCWMKIATHDIEVKQFSSKRIVKNRIIFDPVENVPSHQTSGKKTEKTSEKKYFKIFDRSARWR